MRIERPTVEYAAEERATLAAAGLIVGKSIESPAVFDMDTIRRYYRYSDAATDRLMNIATGLRDDALDRAFEMGLGSLRRTMLHIRDAECGWLKNWTEGSTPGFETLPDTTDLAELNELFAVTRERRETFFSATAADDLQRPIVAQPREGMMLRFRLGEVMLHVCTHGTHHRAQAVNMLRHVGAEAPALDYVVLMYELGSAP
ncbi:MAG: DinB family protein [Phycisphaerae bacterium]